MDLRIQGKIALVTGGGSGIGRAIVELLAKEGAVVAFSSRSQDRIDELGNRLRAEGLTSRGFLADPSSEDGPMKLLAEVRGELGDPEILINNIGDTLGVTDPECGISDWRNVYRLNLESHVEMVNGVLPAMKSRGWGRIVNITAGAGLENSGPVPYSSIKSAYTAYTRSMARVLAPTGVVMSAVLPGVVLTEGGHWQQVLNERPGHAEKYLDERTVLKRFGTPEEIAPFVALLASPLASFAVGSIVPVEGGQARHFFAGNLESYA